MNYWEIQKITRRQKGKKKEIKAEIIKTPLSHYDDGFL